MSTNCIDCTEVYYMYQLDDELRCDDCNEEWKAQNNDADV